MSQPKLVVPAFNRVALTAVLLTAGLYVSGARAAITWDGGGADDFLTTPENWDGDIAPTLNSNTTNGQIILTGSTRTSPQTSVANQIYRSVTFDANASPFTIGGSTTFILGFTNSNNGSLVNDSAFTQTFNVNVEARRTAMAANGGDVVFNGTFAIGATSSNSVTLSGTKDFYFNGGLTSTGNRGLNLGPAFTGTAHIPVASVGYVGNVGIQGAGTLEIADGNALGAGSFFQTDGDTTGTLALTNSINVATPTEFYLYGRSTASPQLLNKSGNNTVSTTIIDDSDSTSNATALHTIESQSGLLTLAGNITTATSGASGYNASMTFTGASNGVVSGNIVEANGNTWSIVKDGAGTWSMSGANNYSGTTHVMAGSLLVNGANSGTGLVTVDSGATLGGGGSISGAVNLSGSIAPGNSPGTLTVGALTLLNGSSANMEMQNTAGGHAPGGGLSDLVNVTGMLQIAAGNPTITINASAVGGGPLGTGAGGTWALATYVTSSVLSTPTWVINGIASGYSAAIDLNTPGQVNLVLTAVPEPSTFVLAGAGMVGLIYFRRRSKSNLR